jgi:hypothetical protein
VSVQNISQGLDSEVATVIFICKVRVLLACFYIEVGTPRDRNDT